MEKVMSNDAPFAMFLPSFSVPWILARSGTSERIEVVLPSVPLID